MCSRSPAHLNDFGTTSVHQLSCKPNSGLGRLTFLEVVQWGDPGIPPLSIKSITGQM